MIFSKPEGCSVPSTARAVVSRAQRGHYYVPKDLLNTIDPVGRSH